VTTAPPGHDEIVLAVPSGRHLCSDRAHRNAGRLADVVVSFGRLGVPGTPREAFWPECWGRSYPMCGACWENTGQVAAKARPQLVIRDATRP